jgi:hypothetical protein
LPNTQSFPKIILLKIWKLHLFRKQFVDES